MKKHILLAEKFCRGEREYDVSGAVWKKAFIHVLENQERLGIEKDKIHSLWAELGGRLRDKIRDDELILSVLLVSLPGYAQKGLELYRGECKFLYEQGKIGFCWTPNVEVARKFASSLNAIGSGGVLLKAFAPTKAIMAPPNDHNPKLTRECEYTCNPKLLVDINVQETFKQVY
jgi:hypothetical protein